MGSTVSMVKRTYVVGRSNRNAPNLYRLHNCNDHLFPYKVKKQQDEFMDIRLNVSLESFNSLVSQRLHLSHKSRLHYSENEIYKGIVRPEKILQAKLISSPEARDVRLEMSMNEKQVYLCRNYITELNEQIGKLTNISVFQICCNYLRYIPHSIGHLSNLKMLILSRNRLMELPDEIGLCKELREIDVSFNCLTRLPKSIAALKRLDTLHVSGNRLKILPNFIGKLTSLKYLNISHNPIKSIPLEIFKLPFLLSLTADGCDLETHFNFKKMGEMTLKETTARNIVRNNLNIYRNLPKNLRDFITSAQECSFCGGPFFATYYEVHDQHFFDGELYPVNYRLCSKHYESHSDRILTLFERSIATQPSKLLQDGMPSVTELFEPFCYDSVQSKKLSDILNNQDNSDIVPLIFLSQFSAATAKRFSLYDSLNEDVEDMNFFDKNE